ncbi:MAG: Polymer-forming cytoskeletal [bacterium ADurb.Bin270]|nr:MAG: Polymer-forming cytoskeletal [bacterium ADurb.Bin270]
MGRSGRNNVKINGLIDKGCSIEGRLAFDGSVQINGDFRGDIVSDGTLIIGPEANVEGSVQVGVAIIEGSVKGTVEVKNKIDLRNGGRLVANVVTESIMIEEGAIFHGKCSMIGAEGKPDIDLSRYSKSPDLSKEDGDSLMM